MAINLYRNRDNEVTMTLLNNEVPVSMSAVTKLEFTGNLLSFNSVDNPEVFIFGVDSVRLRLGLLDKPPGKYHVALIVYFPTKPLGIVWEESIELIFEEI